MSIADTAAVSAAEAQSLFGVLDEFPVVILAVSGGPDSTALMVLAARWRASSVRPSKFIAVTVDHALRPESKREAAVVKRLAHALGIAHRTLRWTGPKPTAGVQQAARNARYRLLAEAARKAGAKHILTAHTLDDQAETVLIRLARGSGHSGLAAMARISPVPVAQGRGIMLVRPLLSIPKSRLIATLQAAKIPYADDPTNRDPRFARARLRMLMPALAREGLTAERLALLARRVERVDGALLGALNEAQLRIAPGLWPDQGPVTVDAAAFFDLPEEIALRLLGRAIAWTGDEGPVELGKLEALYAALERFQAKWNPVRRPEMRQNKEIARFHESTHTESAEEHFQAKWNPVRRPEMRQNKEIARFHESTHTESAVASAFDAALPQLKNSRRLGRTLAGAVITLTGQRLRIERAPRRRPSASKRP